MDDSRPGSDSPVDINPQPLADNDPGIHPSVAPAVNGFADAWDGLVALFFWSGRKLRSGWARANNTPARRGVNAAVAFVLLIAVMVISTMDHKPVSPPPPQVVAAGPDVRTAKLGDGWISIAKANGIANWHDLVDANPDLVQVNTDWCNARPTGANYRAGLRIDGAKRDDDLCVLYPYNGKLQAITTLRVGQRYNMPKATNATALADTTTPPQ